MSTFHFFAGLISFLFVKYPKIISPINMQRLSCIANAKIYIADEKCDISIDITSICRFVHFGKCPIQIFQLYANIPVSDIFRIPILTISFNGDFDGNPGPAGIAGQYFTSCKLHTSSSESIAGMFNYHKKY